MKKNIIRIALDIVMIILLILMYNAKVISITFHELGGLIVCGLFLVHKALNFKWITKVTKRLFDKTLPFKTKLGYAVDVLLLFAVAFIAVSGILISKVLFPALANGPGIMKQLHYFASAAAIILVGVHIGLHWYFISGMFKKKIKLPRPAAMALGSALLIVIIGYGCYSMATTDFSRWLTAPFTAAAEPGGFPERPALSDGTAPDAAQTSGNHGQGAGNGGFGNGTGPHGGKGDGSGGASFSILRVLSVVADFGSITGCFAAGTYWLEKLIKKLANPHRPSGAVPT